VRAGLGQRGRAVAGSRDLEPTLAEIHPVFTGVVWALALTLAPMILVLSLANPAPEDAWAIPMYSLIIVTWSVTGAFLATRLPGNRVGWVMWLAGVGMGTALLGSAWSYVSYSAYDGSLPGADAGAVVGLLFQPALFLVLLVPLVFPDGRLLSRRWSIVAGGLLVAQAAVLVGSLVTPGPLEGSRWVENPLGIPELAELARTLVEAGGLLSILCLPAGIVASVLRYRRGTTVERNQLKWFGSVIVLALTMFLGATLLPEPFGQVAWIVASLSVGLLPIAIGIAVLRYRLYEIDRIISRTIGWAIVSGLLVGAFVLLVLGLTAVLEPLTGGNTLAIAGSTLVVAALFTPVRSRVQRLVDRRFDRSRYDGQRLLAVFGERLRDEVDLPTIRSEVLATVDAAVRPSGAGLWLRRPDAEGGA
jgi:hypothetical protein